MDLPTTLELTHSSQIEWLKICIRQALKFCREIQPDYWSPTLILLEPLTDTVWRSTLHCLDADCYDVDPNATLIEVGREVQKISPHLKHLFLIDQQYSYDRPTDDTALLVFGMDKAHQSCSGLIPVQQNREGVFSPSAQAPLLIEETKTTSPLAWFWRGFEIAQLESIFEQTADRI